MPLVSGSRTLVLAVDSDAALGLAIGLLYCNLRVSSACSGPNQGLGRSTLRDQAEAIHICTLENRSAVCGSRNNYETKLYLCLTLVLNEGTSFHLGIQQKPHWPTPFVTGLPAIYPPSSYMTQLQSHSTVITEAVPAEGVYLSKPYVKGGLLFQKSRQQCKLHRLWKN